MFQLLHSLSAGQLFRRQFPVLVSSLVIAELFYRFHSFTLECGAFLLTWYVLEAVVRWLVPVRSPADHPEQPSFG
jgi:hypothetical protein